jgi:glycine/D-amino acid oxidase-like deaminating enzyme
MTRYGTPFWIERAAEGKVPRFPRLRGSVYGEVAVVGGGFTGAAVAYVFAAAGIRPVVIDPGRIGMDEVSAGTGLVGRMPPFADLGARFGRRAARDVWTAMRTATNDLVGVLRREHIRCDLVARSEVLVAFAEEARRALEREHRARAAAGIDCPWLSEGKTRGETGLDGAVGMRAPQAWLVDPWRACLGLATTATERGADFFEGSPVRVIRPGRLGVEVRTGDGRVEARAVVMATDLLPPAYKPLARHVARGTAYLVATAELAGPLGRGLGRDDLVLRDALRNGLEIAKTKDRRLVAAGLPGPAVPARARSRVLLARAGELMYRISVLYPVISGLRPEHAWDREAATTADGLIRAGRHHGFPRHLFALGCAQGGPAAAFLAAQILLRAYLGTPSASDRLFGFAR